MKFFKFYQNNSGGNFSKDMPHTLVIQAPNAKVANSIAQEHGVYFNGCYDGVDCDCCGDRWSEVSEDDGFIHLDAEIDQFTKVIYALGIYKELV